MNRHLSAVACGLLAMVVYAGSCGADTITDWDTKATAVASPCAPQVKGLSKNNSYS